MGIRRHHFSNRFRLIFALISVLGAAFVIARWPHIDFVLKPIIQGKCYRLYPALTRVSAQTGQPKVEMTSCSFNEMEFDVPTAMIANPRIDRSSGSDIFLVFEDSQRLFQILLSSSLQLKNTLSSSPSRIAGKSLPQQIETIISESSDDFSFLLSCADLMTHEWAISNRELLGVDAQNMTHYSRFAKEICDSIFISTDPDTIDSKQQLRSIYIWESADRQRSGTVWFGDERREKVAWIDAVSDSFRITGTSQLKTDQIKQMSDTEILEHLKIRFAP